MPFRILADNLLDMDDKEHGSDRALLLARSLARRRPALGPPPKAEKPARATVVSAPSDAGRRRHSPPRPAPVLTTSRCRPAARMRGDTLAPWVRLRLRPPPKISAPSAARSRSRLRRLRRASAPPAAAGVPWAIKTSGVRHLPDGLSASVVAFRTPTTLSRLRKKR